MSAKKKEKVVSLVSEENIEDAIYQALLLRADILPTTASEVSLVEEHGNLTDEALPESLLDQQAVLTKALERQKNGTKLQFNNNPDSSADIEVVARAARDGRKIDAETEELMKQAREKYDQDKENKE